MNGLVKHEVSFDVMFVVMSSGTKKVFFIAYLNVFQSVRFNVLKQGKNIRGIVPTSLANSTNSGIAKPFVA